MSNKISTGANASAWEGTNNDKQWFDALIRFMNESWAAVSQIRERLGLNPQYQMSPSEVAKRIEDVSQKLEDKYKEVQALEARKAQLLTKSSPVAGPSGVPRQQQRNFVPNDSRRRLQFSQSSSGSSGHCNPNCPGLPSSSGPY